LKTLTAVAATAPFDRLQMFHVEGRARRQAEWESKEIPYVLSIQLVVFF